MIGHVAISLVATVLHLVIAQSCVSPDPFTYGTYGELLLQGQQLYSDIVTDKPSLAVLLFAFPSESEAFANRVRRLEGPILVLGASGFVGANLFRSLLAIREDVHSIAMRQPSWRLGRIHSKRKANSFIKRICI